MLGKNSITFKLLCDHFHQISVLVILAGGWECLLKVRLVSPVSQYQLQQAAFLHTSISRIVQGSFPYFCQWRVEKEWSVVTQEFQPSFYICDNPNMNLKKSTQ